VQLIFFSPRPGVRGGERAQNLSIH
jgi:hypothetical protein